MAYDTSVPIYKEKGRKQREREKAKRRGGIGTDAHTPKPNIPFNETIFRGNVPSSEEYIPRKVDGDTSVSAVALKAPQSFLLRSFLLLRHPARIIEFLDLYDDATTTNN